jgi:hypothetical protein
MFKTTKDHFVESYIDNNDVVRWKSNDQVPFDDMLTDFLVKDLISSEQVLRSMTARKAEQEAFLEQYVANRKKYGYTEEEKFEMRAAFGDEKVVNIFTGELVQF